MVMRHWMGRNAGGGRYNACATNKPMPLGPKDDFNPMTWSSGSTFFAVLREAAEELLAKHDVAPRVVRYVASMQKWLCRLALERKNAAVSFLVGI